MTKDELFKEIGKNSFKNLERGMAMLKERPYLRPTKKEQDDLEKVYDRITYLQDHLIAVGEAETERLKQIADLSIIGNTIISNIIND